MENLFNISQGLILNDYKAALALQSEEVLQNSNNKRGAVIACETGVSVQVAELKKTSTSSSVGLQCCAKL